MIPPIGTEDWPDYVEDGRIAADRDEQREREERMRESPGFSCVVLEVGNTE